MTVRNPAAAVAVTSHNRPLRLRWLLNALADQTFPAERFEVLVAHDSSLPDTEQLLQTHPLSASGQLRHLSFAPGSVLPGAKRNAAWQASHAPLILFTDDDCRPSADWIEQAVGAAQAHPNAILQGRTVPDPDESAALRGAPWAHTVFVRPPTAWAETCNIAYPRHVLEQVAGFDPQLRVGEDTDLALRARRAGAEQIAAPEMLVYHAVEERGLPATLRSLTRWQDMAALVKRHPEVREHVCARVFWKPEHAAWIASLAGVALARRDMRAATLALPWLALSLRHRGHSPRGILRSLIELPGRAAIDGVEIATLAQGSVRHRTLLL